MQSKATDLNQHYRSWFHARRPDCQFYESAEDVPLDVECARLSRDRNSQNGIGQRKSLRELEAHGVNQSFLDEIGELDRLTYLSLEYPVTAVDLAPLRNLSELRILKINSPRNISDFTPLLDMPKVERLFIENAKQMADLEWLRPLTARLKVLGIEGSMYTSQRIPTLTPLEDFCLEALFLTSTKLEDQSLVPLHRMHSLKYLGTALNAPRAEFEALHAAQPQLECSWFKPEMWAQFRGPRSLKR